VFQLLVTVNVVPSSPNLVALMMEEVSSPETSAVTKTIRRHITDDGIVEKITFEKAERALGAIAISNKQ
jgi:hypothetical protein